MTRRTVVGLAPTMDLEPGDLLPIPATRDVAVRAVLGWCRQEGRAFPVDGDATARLTRAHLPVRRVAPASAA